MSPVPVFRLFGIEIAPRIHQDCFGAFFVSANSKSDRNPLGLSFSERIGIVQHGVILSAFFAEMSCYHKISSFLRSSNTYLIPGSYKDQLPEIEKTTDKSQLSMPADIVVLFERRQIGQLGKGFHICTAEVPCTAGKRTCRSFLFLQQVLFSVISVPRKPDIISCSYIPIS